MTTGYNFSERVQKVLAMAQDEARRRNHEYVGTEHLLAALINEGGGVATSILQNMNVDTAAVMRRLDTLVRDGEPVPPTRVHIPMTTRAKKVLEFAMTEARELAHSYIGTEHVLLGLLREKFGIAAQVLTQSGANIDDARTSALRILGT